MLVATILLAAYASLSGGHATGWLPAIGGFAATATATWIALVRRNRAGRPARPAWIMGGLLAGATALAIPFDRFGANMDWRAGVALAVAICAAAITGVIIGIAIALPRRKAKQP